MPEFLEKKLSRQYGGDKHAIYGTLNKIGAMHGNKPTAKGKAMQAKHEADDKKPKRGGFAKKLGAQFMAA